MTLRIVMVFFATAFLSACSPEVGSEKWCEDLKEKEKGEWTLDETTEYAKSCVF